MHNYAGADSFPANLSIMDDGDPLDATHLNTAIQGNADRTTYVKNRIGNFRLHTLLEASHDDPTFATVIDWVTSAYNTANSLLVHSGYTASVGDVIEMQFIGSAHLGDVSGNAAGALRLEDTQNGGAITALSASDIFMRGQQPGAGTNKPTFPICMRATRTITVAGPYVMYVNGRYDSSSAGTLCGLVGSWRLRAKVLRSN